MPPPDMLPAMDPAVRAPRFAICNELFRAWSYAQACQFVADLGYTGLEVAPLTILDSDDGISARRARELRQAISQAGLTTVGLHWLLANTQGLGLTDSDESVRRQTADYMGELAQLCRDLDGNLMVLGSPRQRQRAAHVSPELAQDYAADCLMRLLPTLEQQRVTLALEPLGPSETNFLNTAAQAVELIEQLDSPWVKLHLDVKAMSSEADPIPEILRCNRRDLVHFHANDANLRGPGMGEIDFVPILRALQTIDYAGWISVEVFDETPGPEVLARESLHNLQRDWEAAAQSWQPGEA